MTVTPSTLPIWLALQVVRLRKQRALQPALEALKKIVLSATLDELVFGDAERGPDEALKLKFESLRQFIPEERLIAEGVLDSLIVQHQARRLFSASGAKVTCPGIFGPSES